MGQRASHSMVKIKHPSTHDGLWALVRKYRQFNINQIFGDTAIILKDSVGAYIRALEKGGYIKAVSEKRPFKLTVYQLINDVGIAAPRINRRGEKITKMSGQERMWKVMQILSDFNKHELAANAMADGAEIRILSAAKYINILLKAKYLIMVKKPAPSVAGRYIFNPEFAGPYAPEILRTKSLYDPNLNKITWSENSDNNDNN